MAEVSNVVNSFTKKGVNRVKARLKSSLNPVDITRRLLLEHGVFAKAGSLEETPPVDTFAAQNVLKDITEEFEKGATMHTTIDTFSRH